MTVFAILSKLVTVRPRLLYTLICVADLSVNETRYIKMILSCQNITKTFDGKTILKQANFHIEDHEKAAMIGINGAGKTTLLNIITGRLQPGV